MTNKVPELLGAGINQKKNLPLRRGLRTIGHYQDMTKKVDVNKERSISRRGRIC